MRNLKKHFFIFGLILIAAPGTNHAMMTGVETPYHPSPICADHIDLSDPDNLWSILSHGIYRSNTVRSDVPKDLMLIQQLTELAFHLQSDTSKSIKNKELLASTFLSVDQEITVEDTNITSHTYCIQALTAFCIHQILGDGCHQLILTKNYEEELEFCRISDEVVRALFFLFTQTAVALSPRDRELYLISLLKQSEISAETLDFFIQIGMAYTSKRLPLTARVIACILAHEKFPEDYLEQLCCYEEDNRAAYISSKVSIAAIAVITIIHSSQATPEHKYTALYQASTRLRKTINIGMLYSTFLRCSTLENTRETLGYFLNVEPLIALAEDYIDKSGAPLKEIETALQPIRDRMIQLDNLKNRHQLSNHDRLEQLASLNLDSPFIQFIKYLKRKTAINWLNSKL